jgi:hypothetical protein
MCSISCFYRTPCGSSGWFPPETVRVLYGDDEEELILSLLRQREDQQGKSAWHHIYTCGQGQDNFKLVFLNLKTLSCHYFWHIEHHEVVRPFNVMLRITEEQVRQGCPERP